MAETQTKPTEASVDAFIEAVPDQGRREDARAIRTMMERVTGEQPRMWGPSIVGFGSYEYKYDSGHEGSSCRLGFSPRKAEQVLYVLNGTTEQQEQLARLGKHKTGKSCLYIKKLADVDITVLEEITRGALKHMDERFPR